MPPDPGPCTRCGEVKPPPAKVFLVEEHRRAVVENVCADCWAEWIEEQTRLINELHLKLARPESHALLHEHRAWFLRLPGATEPGQKVELPPEARGATPSAGEDPASGRSAEPSRAPGSEQGQGQDPDRDT